MANKKRKLKASLLSAITLFLVTNTAHARKTDMEDPPVAAWGCKLDEAARTTAIRHAAAAINWKVRKQEPGQITLRFRKNNRHVLDVIVKHDESSFDVDYKRSEQLNYDASGEIPQIHPNANVWMASLRETIKQVLASDCPAL